ncbi:NPCBM/NEW2 domain-containing protein [Fulvivirgaceae bacterium BMA10]|uniref:NPCBM/NEW2 domain-containing protein n=1 Tax=Splendidivirga corallicola TaxID=3051826 RepID=A0ABT8KNH1_9BACT|nr:NPCBM/NEW2 domain-containing protein [Fulvivirgaceae bacterium BMA10]
MITVRSIRKLVLTALISSHVLLIKAQGPGLGNLTYTKEELFKSIWVYQDPTHYGSNVATMINGYFVTTLAPDSGKPPGGILVFDVSDPRSPKLIKRIFNEKTSSFRESHAFGHYDDYIVMQDGCGIQIWDFSNPKDPKQVVRYCMEGYSHDDYGSSWQLFWQAPYIYVANGSSGYDIIDASDVKNPQKVKHVNIGQQVGPIFAVGNKLITTAHDQGAGYAISDISDPENPVLINSVRNNLQNIYAASLNGYRIISSARGNQINSIFTVHDVKDPINFRKVNELDIENSGAQLYNTSQDNYVIQGCQDEIVKVDIIDPDKYRVVGRGGINVDNPDHGQVTPFGNLIFVGNDHGSGSGFIVHQQEPDTKGPQVNMISPDPQAINQALTTRIGMTFTDQIDLNSVNKQTFIVRPIGGGALSGRYSHQFATVNFTPDEPLLPNTTYEVVVPKNGLSDWVGNRTEHDFISYFSTGNNINTLPATPLRFGGTGEDEQIRLFWDESPGTENYVIERSLQIDGPFTPVKTTDMIGWVDENVETDQIYYYRMFCVNDLGNSTLTPVIEVRAHTILDTPGSPKNVLAKGGKGQVEISWSSATDAKVYNIYRSAHPVDSFEKIAESETTSFIDEEVEDDEIYYYRVSGVNSGLEGKVSFTTKAVTGDFIYLSDLDWGSIVNGWGDAEKDRSNGEQGAQDGVAMKMKNITYKKGLGVHAYSRIDYELGGEYSLFLADIGIDDETNGGGSVLFHVWTDATKVFESESLHLGNDFPESIEVDITGTDKLRLEVTDGGNGNGADHANWANARLMPAETITGLGEHLKTAIILYPNPANSHFMIRGIVKKDVQVIISDISSKILFKMDGVTNEQIIHVDHLPKGIYVASIIGSDFHYNQRLIISDNR